MFSRIKIIFVVFVSFIGIVGCGIKLGERNLEPAPVKVLTATCLKQSANDLKLYFKGMASEVQVEKAVDCLQDVLIVFMENIRGKNRDLFTAREIIAFAERNFFYEDEGGLDLSDDFLKEILALKVALVGGNAQFIHKSELVTLANFLGDIKSDLVGFNSYLKILNSKESINYIDFLEGESRVIALAKKIGQQFVASYDLQSLKRLILEISKGPLKESLKLPDNFEQLFTSAIAAKVTLTGEENSQVSPDGLELLLNIGARAFLNFQEYDFFISRHRFESLQFISGLETLWPKIKETIQIELKLKPSHVLTTDELTQFILVLQEQKIIKSGFQKASLVSTFNAFWSHILNKPEDRIKSVFRKGFDQVALQQIVPELESWIGLQKNISEMFLLSRSWGRTEMQSEIRLRVENEKNESIKKALTDLQYFVSHPIALTTNEKGFLQILDNQGGVYQQRDLTLSNLARTLSRVIIHSYAKDPDRVAQYSAVLQEEIQIAYDQLKPIAVDLDVVDQSNMTFIKSRFIEANLFLAVSDGDNLASFAEIHHLVEHIYSGILRANEIKPQILDQCLPLGYNRNLVKGQTRVSEDCLLDIYSKNEAAFLGMPQYLSMHSLYLPEQIREYDMNLLKAAGHVPNEQKTVMLSDAGLFPHVVQYIEMVYARHDASGDGLLQKEEALAAFPIFENILTDLVKSYKQIKKEDLPGVFIYILKYGRPPNPKSIGEVLKFVAFIKDKEQKDWMINSTRLDLGKIFNYIADATINTPTSPNPTPVPNP